jgi:hypothetical protein
MIVAAIEDLKSAGIQVPLSLHRAAQALHPAKRLAPTISEVQELGRDPSWPGLLQPPRQESDSRGASAGVVDAVGAACGALRTFLRAAAERRAWRSSHLRSARASCSRSRSWDDALDCASFARGTFSGWAFSIGTDISLSAAQDRNFGSRSAGSGGTAAASSVRSVGSAAAMISNDRAISTSGGGVWASVATDWTEGASSVEVVFKTPTMSSQTTSAALSMAAVATTLRGRRQPRTTGCSG